MVQSRVVSGFTVRRGKGGRLFDTVFRVKINEAEVAICPDQQAELPLWETFCLW